MTTVEEYIGLAIGACTLAGFGIVWWRWVRPRYRATKREVVGVRDAILGRDATVDSITGREVSPALPGIGQRIATVEDAVLQLADQRDQLKNHEERIGILEDARAERAIAQAESAAMWHYVGKDRESEGDE